MGEEITEGENAFSNTKTPVPISPFSLILPGGLKRDEGLEQESWYYLERTAVEK